MIGRKVEWRNSFRDYVGVVVSKKDGDCIVYEFNEAEVEILDPGMRLAESIGLD